MDLHEQSAANTKKHHKITRNIYLAALALGVHRFDGLASEILQAVTQTLH
jgi:hypothetical protein